MTDHSELPNSDTIEVDTIFGRIEAFRDDLISNHLIEYGAHTRPELAFLLSVIEPGDCVFDVGGHIGTFAIPIARKIGSGGRLVAVEGNADTFKVLHRNIARHHLQASVLLVNKIIGDPDTRYVCQRWEGNTGGNYYIETNSTDGVNAIHLDEISTNTFLPRVLKMDIEGLEVQALLGSRNLLRSRPILYVEASERQLSRNGSSIEELAELLNPYDYHYFTNAGRGNGAHDDFIVRQLPRLSEGGAFFNFLAVHRTDPRLEVVVGQLKDG